MPHRAVRGLDKSSSDQMTAASRGARRAAALKNYKGLTAWQKARATNLFTTLRRRQVSQSQRINGTTELSILGSSNAFGIWNHRYTIPITFMQVLKMPQ